MQLLSAQPPLCGGSKLAGALKHIDITLDDDCSVSATASGFDEPLVYQPQPNQTAQDLVKVFVDTWLRNLVPQQHRDVFRYNAERKKGLINVQTAYCRMTVKVQKVRPGRQQA